MPYNTLPEYRDSVVLSIDAAGDPDPALSQWAQASARGARVGALAGRFGGALVSGWLTFYDPDKADAGEWPLVHRVPLRAVDVPNERANLPWEVGGRRIYRWTNTDADLDEVTIGSSISTADGDLHCYVRHGEIDWL